MQSALHARTTILPGNRLEFSAPELKEGETVDLIVVLPETHTGPAGSVLEFLDSLPPGPRSFQSWQEFEDQFQEERNSWNR
jgi:hypothetical protein